MSAPVRGRARPPGRAEPSRAARRRRALFSIGGVPVRVDATLLVIAALVLWSFWTRFSGHGTSPAALMALVGTAGFFASILAHEGAHALEAKRRGLSVEDVTLYVFGGATRITSDVKRPIDEFALAGVGPWTSLVLAALFGLVAYGSAEAGLGPVADVAGELGWLNAMLGVFNLLPGAPLDGGRLLDALVWRVTGNRERAQAASSTVGQLLGALIAALGIAAIVFVAGGFVTGLWFVLIGWFILRSAAAERAAASLRAALSGWRVDEVATAPLTLVPPGTPAGLAAAEALRNGTPDLVAVGSAGHIVGVVHVALLARLSSAERLETPIEALMAEVGSLPRCSADAPASDLLAVLDGAPVLVVRDGEVVTVTSRERVLAAATWLAPRPDGAAGRPTAPAPPAPAGPVRHRWRRAALGVASLALVVGSLAVVPLPLLDVGPGPAIDVPSALVTGGPRHVPRGRLLLTSVALSSPSAFGALSSLFSSEHDLVPQSSYVPSGVDEKTFAQDQRRVFADSLQLASAVALRAAGYPVAVRGGGVIVQVVQRSGPADGRLAPGDVIDALNGSAVANSAELIARLSETAPGVTISLQVRRDGVVRPVAVTPEVSSTLGRSSLGIAVEDASPLVKLPFAVRMRRSDIGGPSAGLMMALAVYAVTTGEDLTAGRRIAGTGTIAADGSVGRVGGVEAKVAGALRARATVFLVPAADAATARRAASGTKLRVVPVRSFPGALQALTLPAR